MITSDDITDEIIISLRKIIRAVDLQSKSLMQSCGLTGPQLVVLRVLDHSGSLSSSSLAQRISLSQATVTGVIDRLLKRDLVIRTRDEIDKRRVILQCTEQGSQLAKSAPPILQEKFTHKLNQLADWERHLILSSLQRIGVFMEAESLKAEPILSTESEIAAAKVNKL
jgi:DNA-binding MarR family transcriptional regulator